MAALDTSNPIVHDFTLKLSMVRNTFKDPYAVSVKLQPFSAHYPVSIS